VLATCQTESKYLSRNGPDLGATQGHNGQQAAAAALHNCADHVDETLLAALPGQVPRHPVRGLHHHCSAAATET
jgi:hypothetical protein